MFAVKLHSEIKKTISDIERYERRQRMRAANHVKEKIKRKAQAIKVTGNLAKGVYAQHEKSASFVGIRAPGYQNYLLEFGHWTGRPGSPNRKWVPPHPIVYPAFQEEAAAVERIMSEPLNV